MKTRYLLLAVLLGAVGTAYAQDEYDDIYYSEPKPASTPRNSQGFSKPGSHYVPNMHEVDIDAYNRRGESYYTTPADTIGVSASETPDYIYTQQIQQYYNPTIVVSNQSLLEQVLNGSYGNVNIVYTGSTPYFLPYYAYLPSISAVLPWGMGLSYDWGSPWNWPWYYQPWYNLNYWGWNPGFNWGWHCGWGPAYGWTWGPSWGWDWHHNRHWTANHYRPNMHGNGFTRPGWTSTTRPALGNPQASHRPAGSRPGTTTGGGGTTNHRPGATVRPAAGMASTTSRPGTTSSDRYQGNTVTTHRPGTTVRPGTSAVRPSSGTGTATTRPSTSTTHRPGNTGGYTPITTIRPTGSNNATTGAGQSTSSSHRYDRYKMPPTTNPGTSSRPNYNYSRPNTGSSNYNYSRPNTGSSNPSHNYSRPNTGSSNHNYSRPSYNSGNHRSSGSYSGSGTARSGGASRSTGGGGRHR